LIKGLLPSIRRSIGEVINLAENIMTQKYCRPQDFFLHRSFNFPCHFLERRSIMEKKKRRMVSFVLSTTLGLLFLFMCFGNAFSASSDSYDITLYCGPLGYSSYTLSVGLSEIVNKNSTRIRILPLQTKSNTQSFMEWSMLPKERQTYAMGVVYPLTVSKAKAGVPPFKAPWDVPRLLGLVGNMGCPMFTLDPDIRDGKDLFDKRVSFGPRGSDMEWAYRKIAEKAWGLSEDKYKNSPSGFGVGVDALCDGTLDACIQGSLALTCTGDWEAWVPNPATDRLLSSRETYVISFPEKAFEGVSKASGYPLYPIRYKPLTHGKSDLPKFISFNCSNSWWVSKDLPADVVNEILAIVYEHVGEFANYHASGRGITKQSLSMTYAKKASYHPAARKFYESKGNKFFEDVSQAW
jgi:TRAP-type uncharacterized transport system substrate-binding protein